MATSIAICPSCGKQETINSKQKPINSNPCPLCGTFYCTFACRDADRKIHGVLCDTFRNRIPQPSEGHRLILRFSPGYRKPELLWLDASTLRFTEASLFARVRHGDNRVIRLYHYSKNYSRPNVDHQSISTATSGRSQHQLSGNLVAVCGTSYLPAEVLRDIFNIDMAMYSTVVDMLCGPKVKAVKILAGTSKDQYGMSKMEQVTIKQLHPIFDPNYVSEISKLVDYQLATYSRTDNRKAKDIPIAITKTFTHKEADAMQMEVSVTSKAFGESSVRRRPPAEASYVLLARVNRKDLELHVARAFAHFCAVRIKRHLLPAPGVRSILLMESFRKYLTKENWEKYRNNWMVLVDYDRKSKKVPRKQPVQSV